MPKAMDVNGRWPKPSAQNRSDMQTMCRYQCPSTEVDFTSITNLFFQQRSAGDHGIAPVSLSRFLDDVLERFALMIALRWGAGHLVQPAFDLLQRLGVALVANAVQRDRQIVAVVIQLDRRAAEVPQRRRAGDHGERQTHVARSC